MGDLMRGYWPSGRIQTGWAAGFKLAERPDSGGLGAGRIAWLTTRRILISLLLLFFSFLVGLWLVWALVESLSLMHAGDFQCRLLLFNRWTTIHSFLSRTIDCFPFFLHLYVAGRGQSAANQPSNLAEGHPHYNHWKSGTIACREGDCSSQHPSTAPIALLIKCYTIRRCSWTSV
jgi:hypothetical protein